MGPDHFGLLATVAAPQFGVFSVAQARDRGVDRRRLDRAVAAGTVRRVHSDVYAFTAAATCHQQQVWAAVLQSAPSTASHESSLLLHRVPRMPFVAAVTVGPGRTSTYRGIRVHRVRDLVPAHVTEVDGIPVTTLPRTVVDVASVLSPARLEYLLDRVTITDRTTSLAAINRTLRQINRQGRRHIGVLHRLLDARRARDPAPRSRVERRVDELLAGTSLPLPIREYPMPGVVPGSAFVDRSWLEARLALEVDGRTWHARERSMAKDRARDRAAAREGWLTLRVLDDEVRQLPSELLDDLVVTYGSRIALLDAERGANGR